MKKLIKTEDVPVIRTDFSDDTAWASICEAIEEPVGPDQFKAYVEFVNDSEFEGFDPERILDFVSGHTFAFIVDLAAMTHQERPIIVVDLHDEPVRTFRVIPSEMWAVENNLSLANLGFEEFADSVDRDGIFRGFGRPDN